MATSIKLKSDIKKIEAAIKSKATPKSLVLKLQVQLDKLKSDLASLSSPKPKKGVTKTKVLSSLQKLKAKIKSTKSLSGYKRSGIDIEKDADVPALPLGRRTAKTTGNTYYEYRLNRADVKQPPKRYPKLEKGGYMAKGGAIYSDRTKEILFGKRIIGVGDDYISFENNLKLYYDGTLVGEDDIIIEYALNKVIYEKQMKGGYMAKGGRTLSAINRDRAYKSDEAWEQNYTRKSRPKNPKYQSSSDVFEEGGEMHRLFDDGEA